MKTSLFIFTCLCLFFFTACKKDSDILTTTKGEVEVRFINFEESCNENLELLDGQMAESPDGNYESNFLYGNTWDFSEFEGLAFGETITIKYKILEECPYPHRFILCNRQPGIPIEILKVK